MVEANGATSSSEKKFITFLVNYTIDNKPADLFTNLMHVQKHMTDNMANDCEENLYRKQYGNLKQCVLDGKTIMTVFKLDGTCFKLQDLDTIKAVYEAGNMEEQAWTRCQEGWAAHAAKQEELKKQFPQMYKNK